MKVKTWICLPCLVLAVLAGTGQGASITYVGVHEGIEGAFRTTTVDKPLDGDSDNVYGTDGYLFLNMVSPGDGGGQEDYANNLVESVPSYFSSDTVIPGENVTSANYSGFPDIDDPTQPPGPDVPDISPGYGGYSPSGGGGNAPEQTIFSYEIGPGVTAFRVGIYTDFAQSGEIRVVPNILGLQIGDARVVVDPYTNSHDNNGDMYFFDVTGARPGDVLEIRAGNTVTAHNRNFAVICGLTFDTVPAEKAGNVRPADGSSDVLRGTDLVWTPGIFAGTHDVYFGTRFEDVNDADRADALGVLVSQDQDANAFDPGVLELGQTYYWRVDEVNASPDKSIFQGDVWRFTVEPVSIPILDVTATASSSNADNMGPENTINGIGLNALDQHSTEPTEMWLSGMGDTTPWIQYAFDKPYELHEMWVWNSNQTIESFVGIGAKDVVIETSLDGTEWTPLDDQWQFAQASGSADYVANTKVDFGRVLAQYVRITIVSGYGMLQQYGLSQVRFYYIPTFAREPEPTDGSSLNTVDVTLHWRVGREAASHDLYLGTDPENLALLGQTEAASMAAQALGYDQSYYWQVIEINEAETPSSYAGPVWQFSTPAYGVVDDFDQYDDNCNRIFFAWADGLGHNGGQDIENCDVPPSNGNGGGSIVGNATAPFAEQTIVYAGSQSMPFAYDNTYGPSEATLTLSGQDWTAGGVQSLSLMFYGTPGNTGQLYIKINQTRVDYNGAAADITNAVWQPWIIPLASVSGNLQNVTSLTIGIEGATAKGMLYIDSIRLYPKSPEYIDPIPPDDSDPNLVAYYALDGNTNDSTGKYPASAEGGVAYAQGIVGQAADLAVGTDAVINAGDVPLGTGQISVSCWVYPRNVATDWRGIVSKWTPDNSQRTFWIGQHATDGWLRFGIYPNAPATEVSLDSAQIVLADGQWTHIVCTYDGDSQKIYAQGALIAASPSRGAPLVDRGGDLRFGVVNVNYLDGVIDEVRIYNRAISAGEVLGLAGGTAPVARPF